MAKYRGRFTRTVQIEQEKEIYVEADSHDQADLLLDEVCCAMNEQDSEAVLERYPGTAWTKNKNVEEEITIDAEFDRNLGKKRP